MTVIAVVATPPREGLVLSEVAATSPLSEAEAAELYEAIYRDTLEAVAASGGELLVNYPTDDQLPAAHRTETAPEAELRAIAADTLDSLSDVRFEKQVGSTLDARVGNTITHLLREEEVRSAAAVRPTSPLLNRSLIDAAAMKIRTNDVVLGPSTKGRCFYAAFSEPIDFDGAYATPELQTLAERGRDADLDVEFVRSLPSVETGDDLIDLIPVVRSRIAAERIVPTHTATLVHEKGLFVREANDGELRIVRDQ